MAEVTLPSDASNTGKAVATNAITRDGQQEHMQLINIGDSLTGTSVSVNPAGTSGVSAMAVQGAMNGFPLLISMASNVPAVNGTLYASNTVTANGNTGNTGIPVANFHQFTLLFNLTAVSGTNPQMNLLIQAQDPLSSNWYPVNAQISPITANTPLNTPIPITLGFGTVNAVDFGIQLRVSWTLNGTTPSFTFSISYIGR